MLDTTAAFLRVLGATFTAVLQVPVWLLKATRSILKSFQWARDAADRLVSTALHLSCHAPQSMLQALCSKNHKRSSRALGLKCTSGTQRKLRYLL